MIEITSRAHLEEKILSSAIPVLVDFYADWCSPCQNMLPMVEAFHADNKGKIEIVKVNVDTIESTIPRDYGVRGLPTLVLFSAGKEVSRRAGSISRLTLGSWTERDVGVRDSVLDIDISL